VRFDPNVQIDGAAGTQVRFDNAIQASQAGIQPDGAGRSSGFVDNQRHVLHVRRQSRSRRQ